MLHLLKSGLGFDPGIRGPMPGAPPAGDAFPRGAGGGGRELPSIHPVHRPALSTPCRPGLGSVRRAAEAAEGRGLARRRRRARERPGVGIRGSHGSLSLGSRGRKQLALLEGSPGRGMRKGPES